MRFIRFLVFCFVLSLPTQAFADSPYQQELARLQLADGRVLSVRALWGDGFVTVDPVMAIAVIDDGTLYGVPVAMGPTSDRGRIAARCKVVNNCVVDYYGIGVGPARSFRLNPEALRRELDVPNEWEWCVGRAECPRSGFEEVQPPLVTLEALSATSVASSALKLAPLLFAILLLGLSGPAVKSRLIKIVRWAGLVTGALFGVLSLVWVPYFFLTAYLTSLPIDLALVVLVGMLVLVLRRRLIGSPRVSVKT